MGLGYGLAGFSSRLSVYKSGEQIYPGRPETRYLGYAPGLVTSSNDGTIVEFLGRWKKSVNKNVSTVIQKLWRHERSFLIFLSYFP